MRLEKIGFRKVGIWEKSKKKIRSGIKFTLTHFQENRVIYAFVKQGKTNRPVYIGICESPRTTLSKKMNQYQYLLGGSTNERIGGKIRKDIRAGKKIEIYALNPTSNRKYKKVQLDLVKGLENPLITIFKKSLVYSKR